MTQAEPSRTWPLPLGEPPVLELTTDSVPIELAPVAPDEEPHVEASGRGAADLSVSVTQDNGRLLVDVHRRGRSAFDQSEVRFVVYLPRQVTARFRTDAGPIRAHDLGPCELDLTTDAGAIRLQNVTGVLRLHTDAGAIEALDLGLSDLDATTDAGPIHVRGARGRMRLQTDAGPIRGEDVGGRINAQTDVGPIHLSVTALDPGEHLVRTDVGPVSLDLVPGLDVRVEAGATGGPVQVNYPDRAAAAAVLRVSTDMGPIRVREAAAETAQVARVREPVAAVARRPAAQPDPEVERILKLVEAGELSARDADDLLRALEEGR